MKLLLLSAADIEAALPMHRCVEVMKRAFADFSAGRATVPQRTHIDAGDGSLLVKPACIPGVGLGAKLVSVFPGNASRGRPVTPGIVVLLSPESGEPEALLDGTFLTAWRAGAASGAATDLIAANDAAVGAVIGAGGQARTQVLAIDAVRALREIRVYARTPARVEAMIEELQPRVRARLTAAASPRAALAGAQIVCTATTSRAPVFPDDALAAGAHVNGIGSFTATMQEIGNATVQRAAVFVDSRASAELEAGDLLHAAASEGTDPADWIELGAWIEAGQPAVPSAEITLFKSVGLAVQDIAAGAEVLGSARQRGLGRIVEL